MQQTTMRNAIWALVVSVGLYCMAVAAPGFATARSPECATADSHLAFDLAVTLPSPDRTGGGDHIAILDDQDDLDADATASIGPQDTQFFASIGDTQPKRRAVSVHAGARHSVSRVEPRFLRYCRLLN